MGGKGAFFTLADVSALRSGVAATNDIVSSRSARMCGTKKRISFEIDCNLVFSPMSSPNSYSKYFGGVDDSDIAPEESLLLYGSDPVLLNQ